MGQVISLPQCGLTYPNEWFPTPMPQQDSEGPVVEALAAAVGQLCSGVGRTSGVLTAKTRGPQVARARAPRAMGYFHSDTTLCKRYNTCEVTVSL